MNTRLNIESCSVHLLSLNHLRYLIGALQLILKIKLIPNYNCWLADCQCRTNSVVFVILIHRRLAFRFLLFVSVLLIVSENCCCWWLLNSNSLVLWILFGVLSCCCFVELLVLVLLIFVVVELNLLLRFLCCCCFWGVVCVRILALLYYFWPVHNFRS